MNEETIIMVRPGDTAVFSSTKYTASVADMRSKREDVHDAGIKVFAATGRMDPLVDIHGVWRKSRNAFTKSPDGKFILVNGIKIPLVFLTDGTGSFGKQVAKMFEAMPVVDKMLGFLRADYHTDVSFGVMQDKGDTHGAFLMPQFESSELFASHMRLLVPDKSGGDYPEDYDLGVFYLANYVDADINRYGLKGYSIIVLDAAGRGSITPAEIKEHLGHTVQKSGAISTKETFEQLHQKFHAFVVNVGSDGQSPSSDVTSWWKAQIGTNRVIEAEIGLVAEVQVALIYVTETLNPTVDGLHEVLSASGSNVKIDRRQVEKIWSWIVKAGVPFGEQAKLREGVQLPNKGDLFDHIRHAWPIGHPRFAENTEDGSDGEVSGSDRPAPTPAPTPAPFDWSGF